MRSPNVSWLKLAWASLMNRRVIAVLTVVSIGLSVALLFGVEKIRQGSRDTFLRTISGTDIIVGARTSGVPLLLYSVFHLGDPTQEISLDTFQVVGNRREVDWAVPIALGDSHRGFRVVGTNAEYFDQIKTGRNRPLEMREGAVFSDLFEVVIGSGVAAALDYAPGSPVVIAHGTGVDFSGRHEALPFKVSGILKSTGTPIDRSVFMPLEAMHAIHTNETDADKLRREARPPDTVTAVFVGLKTKMATFSLQRFLNQYEGEPISAVLPGVAFAQLWSIVGQIETALLVISGMVVATAFVGLSVAILSSLEGRRREMAILRAVGAGPRDILRLFMVESIFLTLAGIIFGILLAYAVMALAAPLIEANLGIAPEFGMMSQREIIYIAFIAAGGVLAGLFPAWRAYRSSVSDGLTVRV